MNQLFDDAVTNLSRKHNNFDRKFQPSYKATLQHMVASYVDWLDPECMLQHLDNSKQNQKVSYYCLAANELEKKLIAAIRKKSWRNKNV